MKRKQKRKEDREANPRRMTDEAVRTAVDAARARATAAAAADGLAVAGTFGRLLRDGQGPWTKLEERVIVEAIGAVGNEWAAIAAVLPGRTVEQVKSHWRVFWGRGWGARARARAIASESAREARARS